jgi:hypothetical protein
VDNQILLEVTRLVSLQSKLLVVMAAAMVRGLVVLGLQLRAVSAALKAIAAMTAEVLRRTPERETQGHPPAGGRNHETTA